MVSIIIHVEGIVAMIWPLVLMSACLVVQREWVTYQPNIVLQAAGKMSCLSGMISALLQVCPALVTIFISSNSLRDFLMAVLMVLFPAIIVCDFFITKMIIKEIKRISMKRD